MTRCSKGAFLSALRCPKLIRIICKGNLGCYASGVCLYREGEANGRCFPDETITVSGNKIVRYDHFDDDGRPYPGFEFRAREVRIDSIHPSCVIEFRRT
eukprot:CAMPEP_0182590342 /NCGR_PEP_ID=MMETSP1324-20130603/71518_1 /TAXON_ID=236786 /ORGANISM="Florenciella sp., Strain RCC1587" /LENGTH=98 /DNA_ID=CAMNT_0024807561 /DNA_START=40 /DNA_END=336 /DNA_ORIENTATION=+